MKPVNVWEFVSKCAYNGIAREEWTSAEWFTAEYLQQMQDACYGVCSSRHRYRDDIFQDALVKFLKHYDRKIRTLPANIRDRKAMVPYDWHHNNRIAETLDEKMNEYLGQMILASEDEKDVYNMKPMTLEKLFKTQVADTRKDAHKRKKVRLEIEYDDDHPLSVTIHLEEVDGGIVERLEHNGCRSLADLRADSVVKARVQNKVDAIKKNARTQVQR